MDPDNALLGLRLSKTFVRKYWLRTRRVGGTKKAPAKAEARAGGEPVTAPAVETKKTLLAQLMDWTNLDPDKLSAQLRLFTSLIRSSDLYSEGDVVMVKGTIEADDVSGGSHAKITRTLIRFARVLSLKGETLQITFDPREKASLVVPMSDALPLYADMLGLLDNVSTMQKLISDQIVDCFEDINKLLDVRVRALLVAEFPDFDLTFLERCKNLVELRASDLSRLPVLTDILQRFLKLPQFDTYTEEAEAEIKERLSSVERSLESDLLFPPHRETSKRSLRDFDFSAYSLQSKVSDINTTLLTAMDHLRNERQKLLDGTTKSELAEWWLNLIETSVDNFLLRHSFRFEAIPENYTEECPSDMDLIKSNLELVRRFITGRDERSQSVIKLFVSDLRAEIYVKIDRYLVDIYYLIASELKKHGAELPDTPQDMASMEAAFQLLRPQLEKRLPEVVFYLEEQIADAKYITEMKEAETDLSGADPKAIMMSRIVPIGGLIFSRFFRVENELMTIIDLWDNSRMIKARLASPPRQARSEEPSASTDRSRSRSPAKSHSSGTTGEFSSMPRRATTVSGVAGSSIDRRISRENLAAVMRKSVPKSAGRMKKKDRLKKRDSSKKLDIESLSPRTGGAPTSASSSMSAGGLSNPSSGGPTASDMGLSISLPNAAAGERESLDSPKCTPTSEGAAFAELKWDAVIKQPNNKILRVFLDNRNFKTVAITLPATAEDVCQAVLKKCRDIDTLDFCLYQQHKQLDIEPFEGLPPKLDIGTLMSTWTADHRFMFKRRPLKSTRVTISDTSSIAAAVAAARAGRAAPTDHSVTATAASSSSSSSSISSPTAASASASGSSAANAVPDPTEPEPEIAPKDRLLDPLPANPIALELSVLFQQADDWVTKHPPLSLPRLELLPSLDTVSSAVQLVPYIKEALVIGRSLCHGVVQNLATATTFLSVMRKLCSAIVKLADLSPNEQIATSFRSSSHAIMALASAFFYNASGFVAWTGINEWNACKSQMLHLLSVSALPKTLSAWIHVPLQVETPQIPTDQPPTGAASSSTASLPRGRKPK